MAFAISDIIFGCLSAIGIVYYMMGLDDLRRSSIRSGNEDEINYIIKIWSWALGIAAVLVGIQIISASLALYAVQKMKPRCLFPYLIYGVNIFVRSLKSNRKKFFLGFAYCSYNFHDCDGDCGIE